MSIFELAENLILVLTKLDTEHGLAQPQLVESVYHHTKTKLCVLSKEIMIMHQVPTGTAKGCTKI